MSGQVLPIMTEKSTVDKDGIVFIDKVSKSKVIYNGYTFKELLKGIIIKYANKSKVEADMLVANSELFLHPVNSFDDAMFFQHDLEYHWAMVIVYGRTYWWDGISSKLPDNYFEWESEYIAKRGLKKSSFEILEWNM